MSFILPYIGGRDTNAYTTKGHLLQSIRSKLANDNDIDSNARKVFRRPLTPQEILSVAADIAEYENAAFESKVPAKPYEPLDAHHMQGAPGGGKTEGANALYESWDRAIQNKYAFAGYDEYGAIAHIGLFQSAILEIENRDGLSDEERFDLRLAARDIVRDATAVGKDLVEERALAERFNVIVDTTMSSPHAIASLQRYRAHGYKNSVTAFAPMEESLQRMFNRVRALDLKSEGIGKRGPTIGNGVAAMDEVLQHRGNFDQNFTPKSYNRFITHDAFTFENGILVQKDNQIIKAIVETLFNDLRQFDDLVAEYGMDGSTMDEEKTSLVQGSATYIERLNQILRAKEGASFETIAPV